MTDADLPPLYHAADESSTRAQKLFLRLVVGRLFFLLTAALFGFEVWKRGSSPVDWAGVAAAFCFALALLVEVYLYQTKPERTWYEGRAAAESVKSLSWKYAVGGEPFNLGTNAEDNMADLFLERLRSVFEVLKDLDLVAPTSGDAQISEKMKSLRALQLPLRMRAYEDSRVSDQQRWYQAKSKWNRGRASGWNLTMLFFEILGVAFGILKAVGVISGDLLTLSGVIVAAITAWLQTKQHRTLAVAYGITALELASVRSKIANQNNETEWAKFVNDAEEAISREHTLWKASRGVQSA
jgi:hypothetical protein